MHLKIIETNSIQLQENIEAKREMNGNFDSMVLLLDCLKRRENWPEEFISALEECNHPTVAADIRREYDALRGSKSVLVIEKGRCRENKTCCLTSRDDSGLSSFIGAVNLSGLLHNNIRDAVV